MTQEEFLAKLAYLKHLSWEIRPSGAIRARDCYPYDSCPIAAVALAEGVTRDRAANYWARAYGLKLGLGETLALQIMEAADYPEFVHSCELRSKILEAVGL